MRHQPDVCDIRIIRGQNWQFHSAFESRGRKKSAFHIVPVYIQVEGDPAFKLLEESNISSFHSSGRVEALISTTASLAVYCACASKVNPFSETARLLSNKRFGTEYDSDIISVDFNKSMIVNDSDTVAIINNSLDIVPERILLAHHPFVTDPDEAMAELEEQRKRKLQQAQQTWGAYGKGADEDEEEDDQK